jgi:hypothetical protein
MATTYELISKSEVGSGGVGSIEFTTIPSTFTDLLVRVSVRNNGQVFGRVTFNGSSSNYSKTTILNANGSLSAGASSDNDYTIWSPTTSSTANTYGFMDIYIPDYRSSAYKCISMESLTENNAASPYIYAGIFSFIWSNTSPITSIELTSHNSPSNKWTQYSSAYLYGIKNS